MMQIFSDNINPLRDQIIQWKDDGNTIGFAPTMGNLHDGHMSLVRNLKKNGATKIIVSIFVNPRQFGPSEDFNQYPRTLKNDLELLEKEGVDLVFCPEMNSIYPSHISSEIIIDNPKLMNDLCGKKRPGHFNGVLLVVNKLFNIIRPDIAIFGQKDYQQFILIKNMIENLFMEVDLILSPIIRESNGLALSSRNSYLSHENKRVASEIYASLLKIKDSLYENNDDIAQSIQLEIDSLNSIGFEVEYLELRTLTNLEVCNEYQPGKDKYILLIASKLGNTRLIDNLIL
jgi:pantoate--beta-alanine ligase